VSRISRTGLARATEAVVIEQGWRSGTTLENRIAYRLKRYGLGPDVVAQQYRVGRYRLDFAWPHLAVGLEVDGWWHRSPEGAARDAVRDAALRADGWIVFRIDDRHGEDQLEDQLARVCQIVKAIEPYGRTPTGRWGVSQRARRERAEASRARRKAAS
jgi:very-short-patch-repair endonuclease